MIPFLSLVTGSMDRPGSLARLIGAVRQRTTVEWELIIVDSSNEEPKRLMDENAADHRLRFLRDIPVRGFCRAYNSGFELATGEWVIWLNDDAEPLASYDRIAIDFMTDHPKIGLGALSYYDKQFPHLGYHVNTWQKIPYANFGIIRRELGNQIGWFDTDFYMYGGDNSITCRVLLSGFGVAPIPDAKILHHAIQDSHRLRNAHGPDRIQDGRNFVRKYLPHLSAMQQTYREALNA